MVDLKLRVEPKKVEPISKDSIVFNFVENVEYLVPESDKDKDLLCHLLAPRLHTNDKDVKITPDLFNLEIKHLVEAHGWSYSILDIDKSEYYKQNKPT